MMLKDTNNTNKMNIIDLSLPKIANKVLVTAKDIFLILSFAVLTGISSKLIVEIGPVPITMQTLAVLLSGALLGKKRGTISQITYLFLGCELSFPGIKKNQNFV